MSYDSKLRSIDRWRHDVAKSAEVVVVPAGDSQFRRGYQPQEVLVSDALDKYVPSPSTVDYNSARKSSKYPSRMRVVRRPSSDYGGGSRRKSTRSPTRTVGASMSRISGSRRASLRPTSVIREQSPPPPSRSRTTKTQPSLWSSILPSARSSRARTIIYQDPPLPRRYTRSPSPPPTRRYASTRISEPDRSRRASHSYQPLKRTVSRKETRRDSLDVDQRMRLLDIRDRFRDEVDRARRYQSVERPLPRRRDYDRRSVR
ncbi:hypothetical protein EJ08DRAFT_657913 [Tothia fuscella]|uniref:Uncharacterized protein n=1 Tax=Tothia fuscella TaxID=1048955 RepID=A0A9P4NYN8_9PEZI|nr:hypothetical protein EJ08DRAFT_657913 [Tothia fuscella]